MTNNKVYPLTFDIPAAAHWLRTELQLVPGRASAAGTPVADVLSLLCRQPVNYESYYNTETHFVQ